MAEVEQRRQSHGVDFALALTMKGMSEATMTIMTAKEAPQKKAMDMTTMSATRWTTMVAKATQQPCREVEGVAMVNC